MGAWHHIHSLQKFSGLVTSLQSMIYLASSLLPLLLLRALTRSWAFISQPGRPVRSTILLPSMRAVNESRERERAERIRYGE
jgi:hypothetical protein